MLFYNLAYGWPMIYTTHCIAVRWAKISRGYTSIISLIPLIGNFRRVHKIYNAHPLIVIFGYLYPCSKHVQFVGSAIITHLQSNS